MGAYFDILKDSLVCHFLDLQVHIKNLVVVYHLLMLCLSQIYQRIPHNLKYKNLNFKINSSENLVHFYLYKRIKLVLH